MNVKTLKLLFTVSILISSNSFANDTEFEKQDIRDPFVESSIIIGAAQHEELIEFSEDDSKKLYNRIQATASKINDDPLLKDVTYRGNSQAFCVRKDNGALAESNFRCYMNQKYVKDVFKNSDSKKIELSPVDEANNMSAVSLKENYNFNDNPENSSMKIRDIIRANQSRRHFEETGWAQSKVYWGNESAECVESYNDEHSDYYISCGFDFHALQNIFHHEQLDTTEAFTNVGFKNVSLPSSNFKSDPQSTSK